MAFVGDNLEGGVDRAERDRSHRDGLRQPNMMITATEAT